MEQRLLDIDLDIKKALHFERPDMAKCLKALEELDSLALAPLMLKKQPDIVTTIRKIRKYVGPQMVMEAALADDWTQKSKKIRLKANQVRIKCTEKKLTMSCSQSLETYMLLHTSDLQQAAECICRS